ncbi:YwpF-like family protein [Bacillus pumilus]|uniref:YwpF-like family protein n=1 Tax=Bacillus pumilus TaxID=1408 RepID=UPI00164541BC|nr:YwpF-like family protein [Bacillus pumilus]MBC3646930.1 YwpF-like family protein [Bacillus pumilus]
MKTFRLIDLKIELDPKQDKMSSIPLRDGLIINKEDGENHWMIEALIPKKLRQVFEVLFQQHTEVKILVTITKENNRPVHLSVQVKNIVALEENISVLLDGKMITNRYRTETEEVLKDLVKEGLSGEKLLDAFKQNT